MTVISSEYYEASIESVDTPHVASEQADLARFVQSGVDRTALSGISKLLQYRAQLAHEQHEAAQQLHATLSAIQEEGSVNSFQSEAGQ